MKRTNIIAIALIAVGIAALLTVAMDFSSYKTFKDAKENEGRSLQIVGYLSKDKPMYYNPEEDANYFSFYMKDKKDEERKVVFLGAKPQDFERSEELVLTGKLEGDEFKATDMLMKCPSKYEDEEIQVKSVTAKNG